MLGRVTTMVLDTADAVLTGTILTQSPDNRHIHVQGGAIRGDFERNGDLAPTTRPRVAGSELPITC